MTARDGGRADLVRRLAARRAPLVLAAGCGWGAAAAMLAQPVLVREAVDAVQRREPVTGWALALLGVLVLGGLLSAGSMWQVQRVVEAVVLDLRRELAAGVLRARVDALPGARTGDVVSRMSGDTAAVRTSLVQATTAVLGAAPLLLGSLVAMVVVDSVLAAVTVGVVVLAAVSVLALVGRVERASEELRTVTGSLATAFERTVRGLRTIRVSNATERELARVDARAGSAHDAGLALARALVVLTPVSVVTVQLAVLTVLAVGGARVAAGGMSVAALVQFTLFAFLMVMPLNQGFAAAGAFAEASGAVRRVRAAAALPTEPPPTARRAAAPGGSVLRGSAGPVDVRLEDVRFGYTDADGRRHVALRGVDLHVAAGRRVAVVGPSGAGKSTLLGVLARLHETTGGTVLVGGHDVRGMPVDELRAVLGYVEQDAPVLTGSLRENLLLAAPEADEASCREMLRAVGLDHLVERADGLDADAGEGGAALSGGERQRLALARSLLARPRLLLLDEVTSSLDGDTEGRVLAAVRSATTACTVVVVAHRLSTVLDCDEVVMLDEGRVVARGSHADLLGRDVRYRRLVGGQLAQVVP